jgi:protocatechuate 3,4-dioxygenase beta subunit
MRTPDQFLGPYFPAGVSPVTSGDLTSNSAGAGRAQGNVVEIGGRVVNVENEPISGARILVWQANCFGRYAHPNDLRETPLDPNFQGFGEIRSDESGCYRIRTVKPGAYPAVDGWTRAPHIHFEVYGQFERLVTQMYFPGEPLNREDRFLLSLRQPDLLIARTVPSNSALVSQTLRFDIVLLRG